MHIPANFSVNHWEMIGGGLVADVLHENRRKILVFVGLTPQRLYELKELDVRFNTTTECSPVARFEPTDRGWRLARVCAAAL